jgi:predicted RNase H-like HicB family nuclease
MLSEYIHKQLRKAHYKLIEDGTYFGEIPGLKGVWANEKKLEKCREELKSALEDWIMFSLHQGQDIPALKIGSKARIKEYA